MMSVVSLCDDCTARKECAIPGEITAIADSSRMDLDIRVHDCLDYERTVTIVCTKKEDYPAKILGDILLEHK